VSSGSERFVKALVGGRVVDAGLGDAGPFVVIAQPEGSDVPAGEGKGWAVSLQDSPRFHWMYPIPEGKDNVELEKRLAENVLGIMSKVSDGSLDAEAMEQGIPGDVTSGQLAAAAIVEMCRQAFTGAP
jgi:hypothetical protein